VVPLTYCKVKENKAKNCVQDQTPFKFTKMCKLALKTSAIQLSASTFWLTRYIGPTRISTIMIRWTRLQSAQYFR